MRTIHQSGRFNLLRLSAALAVLFAHGDFLFRLHLPVPFPGHSLGSLAVYVFFFISGYQVCQSWSRRPAWSSFCVKRAMRIFPGLVVAVAFSVFVIGWSVTTLSSADYWRSAETWLNLASNAAGLATVQTLPGVFESNPFARTVNGSLWTIRYELAMYCLLATVALGARGRRWVYPMAACVLVILWEAARLGRWDATIEEAGGALADVFRWRDFCGFGVPFFVGCAVAAYAVRPQPWMGWAAALAVGCALYSTDALLIQCAVWGFIVLGTFYVALADTLGQHGMAGERVDLSYGVYIYAFPVQQAVTAVSLREGWPFTVCLLLSLVLVLMLAVLSWYCVERPCIRAASRWRVVGRLPRSMPAASS